MSHKIHDGEFGNKSRFLLIKRKISFFKGKTKVFCKVMKSKSLSVVRLELAGVS